VRRAAAALALGALLALAPAASAKTITVTSTQDSGPGTIRQALLDADDGDTIAVSPGNYAVTSSGLLVTKGVTIKGTFARTTVLQADGNNRVFDVAAAQPVTIAGVEIKGGYEVNGGGIRSLTTSLTLDAVELRDNTAGGSGDGGGVYTGKPLTIKRSSFYDNTGVNGGAIAFLPDSGDVRIVNSTFKENHASGAGNGGALYLPDSVAGPAATTVTIANVTAGGNTTPLGGATAPPADTGGLIFIGANDTFRYRNTIFQGNNAGHLDQGPTCWPEPGSTMLSLGGNRFQDFDRPERCDFTGPNDYPADPQTGEFADWGGPTDTMKLEQQGSPVEDADPADENCPATDQRGVPRPQGKGCEPGAFELSHPTGTVGAAQDVKPTSVTVPAIAYTQGLPGTAALVDNFGSTWRQRTLPAKPGGQPLTFKITGLQPSHAYHLHLKVTNIEAFGAGAFRTFITPPAASSGPPPRCRVPNLRGLTRSVAKRELLREHCALGKVYYRRHGRASRHPVVVKQSLAPSSVRPAGTTVNVTLTRRAR
jgi:hypothetical protein